MKKLFLLLTVILLSTLNVNATNWKPLSVSVPNINVYYDADALRTPNNNEYYYTIRYQALGQTEKIVYIKGDSKTKCIGIIYAGEYDPDIYRPNAYFATPHAIMKSVDENSFLYYTNNEIAKIVNGYVYANNGNIVPVSYKSSQDAKLAMTSTSYINYMEKACEFLKNNWNAPASAANKRAVIKATIGNDGSLMGYKIIESSSNDEMDRSIISAIEKTVLFPIYAAKHEDIQTLDFQFTFVKGLVKKKVVY